MERVIAFSLFVLCACPLGADESSLGAEPEVVFLTPFGGQRGTTQTIEIWGKTLDEASAVIFETKGITARVEKVEAVSADAPEKKAESDFRVVAVVEIGAMVEPGNHWVRVVTPNGVSNRRLFRVNVDPVIPETKTPHSSPDNAQPIVAPVVINGTIATPAEVDFYEFEVTQPGEITFEVRPSYAALAKRCRLQISIFKKMASFFDPEKLARLAFADVEKARGEKVTMDTDPREHEGSRIPLSYHFSETGRYFVTIGSLRGISGPNFVYQLRMIQAPQTDLVEAGVDTWKERSFLRPLSGSHLTAIRARGARSSEPSVIIKSVDESEPNSELGQALEVPVPGIAQGAIAEADDVDVFKVTIADGQKLAFEVETPSARVPQFNPIFEVLDSNGDKQISSLQHTEKYTGPNSIHMFAVSAKVTRTFEKGGDFYLRIKDATVRNGAASFVYRVLIREQIPHVGNTALETRTRSREDARLDPLRANLVVGQARKITVLLDHEEGLFETANQISVSFDGLPEGVDLHVASGLYGGPVLPLPVNVVNRDAHRPVSKKIAAVLYTREDAPTTAVPTWVTVSAHPIVGGTPAAKLIIGRIPIMVLPPRNRTLSF